MAEDKIVICGRLGGKQGAQEASLNGWVSVTGRCHSAHTSPEALSQLQWQRKGGREHECLQQPRPHCRSGRCTMLLVVFCLFHVCSHVSVLISAT